MTTSLIKEAPKCPVCGGEKKIFDHPDKPGWAMCYSCSTLFPNETLASYVKSHSVNIEVKLANPLQKAVADMVNIYFTQIQKQLKDIEFGVNIISQRIAPKGNKKKLWLSFTEEEMKDAPLCPECGLPMFYDTDTRKIECVYCTWVEDEEVINNQKLQSILKVIEYYADPNNWQSFVVFDALTGKANAYGDEEEKEIRIDLCDKIVMDYGQSGYTIAKEFLDEYKKGL